jgi:hypothetical protein
MTPEAVLRALLAIWDELPDLVGDDWPRVLPELSALLDRLKATKDPDVTTEIVLTLRGYPSARSRLQEAAAAPAGGDKGFGSIVGDDDKDDIFHRDGVDTEIEEDTSAARAPTGSSRPTSIHPSVRTRSAGLAPQRDVNRRARGGIADDSGPSLTAMVDELGERAADANRALDAETAIPAAPTVTCHVHAEMDQTLTVDRVATVEVIVSREDVGRATHEAAAEGEAEVDPGRRLIIQVLPKIGVEVVGESRAEIEIPATGEPTTVYFDIRPTDSGQASVWVVARQGQIPLVTLKLTARVVGAGSRARSTARGTAEGQASGVPAPTEPLHQLRISQAERGGTLYYEYELEAPALGLLDRFESAPITADPQTYVSNLHATIEERWLSTKGDIKEFTQELREFGGQLLEQLIPDKLQEILWVNRKRFTSIQVLATEPFIPWELVHLRQPGRPLPRETRFLGQMGLVRWLYDSGWPPERLQVRPTRARYVIPDYPDRRYALPDAQAEGTFLEKAFGATAVVPQPTPVRELLSTKGAFDLLHFAGHGAAETEAITEARLLLQGRIEDGRYIEAPLTTTTVNTRANLRGADGSRPLVVLNACQAGRLGYGLTGIGGFAQAFLNGGAGAFVGTQWSVGDVPARVFTETFYTKLLEGRTVAEATVASREQARADGDATWLAYAVYAHPHARLARQGTL